MEGRNEDKRPIYLSTSCCSQKLDEMEKNGNYSPAKEEENDMTRRGTASWPQARCSCVAIVTSVNILATQSQRSVRDPSAYLSINEDDEIG